jgi:threonine dehydrogenase-like Zn-dependent dehydrogenase
VAEVIDYEEPPLQPKQVRVRTELASGKHGTTTAMFDGSTFRNQVFDQTMRMFLQAPPPDPAAPEQKAPSNAGNIGVGVVIEVGSQVSHWQKGDRVFGAMDVRETNVCGEEQLWELGTIAPETALCLEPAYVSLHCIREGNVRYGDSVAVIGLGAIGLIAVEMARRAGADMVLAADPLEKRRQWALDHGADAAFDPRSVNAARKIHEATGLRGVDVAIEAAGTYPALNTALQSVRVCGTVCSAGFYQGESKGLFLGREWHHNRLNIVVPHGCGWGHPPRDYPGWDNHRAQNSLVAMMRRGTLTAKGLIDPIVPLDQGPEVYALMRDDPGRLLKYGVRFP